MFSSIIFTCCLPANLALAVLKCHLPAAKVGKAGGTLCLRLSWISSKGGKHSRTDLSAPFLYAEALICLTCLQPLHCKTPVIQRI